MYFTTQQKNVQREPMSISSITTNHLPRLSTDPSSTTKHIKEAQALPHYNYFHHIAQNRNHLIRSPPTTPEQDQYIHSPPSSPHSFDFSPTSSTYREEEENNYTNNKAGVTLQERRQRNKVASAKYRQKKNIQQHEMRTMINQISERNALLERQLREVREENQKLKSDADKLRGKFVAKKLLRQWMDRQKNHRLPLPTPFGNDFTTPYKQNYIDDIDLLDDVDDIDDDLVSLSSDI